ncbi:aminomethyl-transferring glycine dehydrogenase [Fontivita pretiosa]|uniref:aminomethyl-transferring glycine dehydrogenase n=1 Tax=Fontivita pretiosa TaxID=2989684 RepID=UPI003D1844CC
MTTNMPESQTKPVATLANDADFIWRHIGPREQDVRQMLALLGVGSLDELIEQTVPPSIRMNRPLDLPPPVSEFRALNELRAIATKNRICRSFIGQGYYDTITPPVILRNILENPGWYTQYTPYQAEISQGRLEALLNFQTMVADLTGLPLANASLLDEATAAAEAMAMCHAIVGDAANRRVFLVADDCHPQTIAVVRTRARSLGYELDVCPIADRKSQIANAFGILLQYPTTDGRIVDYTDVIEEAHKHGALVVMATDLLAMTLIRPPGELGADIAVGSSQRFGVPMGFGGPHAAFMATRQEYVRRMPGRIVGVSKDAHGNIAYRLALQTREQHIRREKATSNICTAQVLPAIMASMYAVYHGPQGLKRIAQRVHRMAVLLAELLRELGHELPGGSSFFDTLRVRPVGIDAQTVIERAAAHGYNLRDFRDGTIGISCDETTDLDDIDSIVRDAFGSEPRTGADPARITDRPLRIANRQSPFLTHPVFNSYHSETEMLRYIFRLQSRDLSLAQSMIPLGSCTMKLNATSEMLPITWPEFARIHPYAPPEQTQGYQILFEQLEKWLAEITGFEAISLQPNAGSQGEYAGLLAIRGYHESRGEAHRDVCLIPTSAHGTNPASAVIAGFKVVAVGCDAQGNIDIEDLNRKAEAHKDRLGALMVTYPSTHGVFEEGIREICQIMHRHGGQVYLDGANMNAMVGICRPGDIGADVCHLNLHKTFCIPHGGGGPGMGPIGVAKHLVPFLPGDPLGQSRISNPKSEVANRKSQIANPAGPVSAAAYGSASILPISWMYIRMMGECGLKLASQIAILNANYMARRLDGHYEQLYKGRNGRVAHEFIVDCSTFQKTCGVTVEDIAKRLMDYGFHAPTMSWPEPGTLMIEPTESEPKAELDRLCDALIRIRQEIAAIESGQLDRADNPLKHAPHTAPAIAADNWPHKYSREQAAYPAPWLREYKFWPHVARIDNPYGDRNLFCTCVPVK